MAFLCPVRMRRDKKKATNANIERDLPGVGLGLNHGMGRITGSSSIETLVRVGIEKEHGLSPDSKMVVLHDFTPCVDDELEVKRGQIVNILYRENDWVYVIGQDSRQEGFIPFSYCAPYNTQLAELAIKKKLPREQATDHTAAESVPLLGAEAKLDEVVPPTNGGGGASMPPTMQHCDPNESADCQPFHKEPHGRFIVLYTFIARDENDLSVERGEFVTVLNRDDLDWFWIVRSDGQEGFIPSAFAFPADSVLQTQQKMLSLNGAAKATDHTGNLNSLGQQLNATTQLEDCVNALQQHQQQQQQQQQTQQQQQQQPPQQQSQQLGGVVGGDGYHGTELVMLYDYHKAQAPDDLSVRRGDWIYADLNNQTVDGWLWAYAPKTRKYGFIPKSYARPPAMTSL